MSLFTYATLNSLAPSQGENFILRLSEFLLQFNDLLYRFLSWSLWCVLVFKMFYINKVDEHINSCSSETRGSFKAVFCFHLVVKLKRYNIRKIGLPYTYTIQTAFFCFLFVCLLFFFCPGSPAFILIPKFHCGKLTNVCSLNEGDDFGYSSGCMDSGPR